MSLERVCTHCPLSSPTGRNPEDLNLVSVVAVIHNFKKHCDVVIEKKGRHVEYVL